MGTQVIEQFRITNEQLRNYINDLSNEEGKKVFKPMNCISWLIGHLGWVNYRLVSRGTGIQLPGEYIKFANGSPHFQPDLDYVIDLWENSVIATFGYLDSVNEADLNKLSDVDLNMNLGTDISRLIFHGWNHMGEIASVRQLLGKDPGNPGYGQWDWRY